MRIKDGVVNISPETGPPIDTARSELVRLIEIMAALRTPVTGCPWDLVQDFRSIAPYTIEEAHEVADAIERDDMVDLVDELGDLLLQVVYHARLAEEAGHFVFADVVRAINGKMIRRHPHVFGDTSARTAGLAKGEWDRIKAQEKADKLAKRGGTAHHGDTPETSALSGVPASLPGLTRAVKLQDKAGKVGFDWNDPRAVIAKIREELIEVEEALDQGTDADRREEIGDLLFVMANLARHASVDPEAALRGANAKFMRRFLYIERELAGLGRTPAQSTLDEMDTLWNAAKALEKAGKLKL
jgi:nucleoside triphosphate diphosphatase